MAIMKLMQLMQLTKHICRNTLFAALLCLSFCAPMVQASAQMIAVSNSICPTKLYSGINNQLEIACEAASSASLKVSVGRGTLTGGNGIYHYKTDESGPVEIVLSAGGRELSRQSVPVFPFPTPKLCSGLAAGKTTLTLRDLTEPFKMTTIFGRMPGVKVVRLCVEFMSGDGFAKEEIFSGEALNTVRSELSKSQYGEYRKYSIKWVEYMHPKGTVQKIEYPKICNCAETYQGGAIVSSPPINKGKRLSILIAPYPEFLIRLGGCKKNAASKEEIMAQRELIMSNIYGSNTFNMRISGFMLTIQSSSGAIKRFVSPTSLLTPAMQEAIAALEGGEYLEFTYITASNSRKKGIRLPDLMMRVK